MSPAPFWKRALAYATDSAILGAVFYLVMAVLVAMFAGTVTVLQKDGNFSFDALPDSTKIAVAIVLLLVLLGISAGMHAYFIFNERKRGATPGKRIFGLRVISLNGDETLTFSQCATREVFRYVDVFLLFPGVISILWTEKGQRLGDLVASTMVVHSRTSEEKEDFMYLAPDEYRALLAELQPAIPSDAEREQYLEFAYPTFILGTHAADAVSLSQYEVAVRDRIGPAAASMDARTLLVFYAEFCCQTLNEEK